MSLGCVTRSYLSYACRTLNPACFRTWSALMRSTRSKLAKQILTGIAPFRLKGNSDLSKLILPDQKTDKRRTHTRTHTHTDSRMGRVCSKTAQTPPCCVPNTSPPLTPLSVSRNGALTIQKQNLTEGLLSQEGNTNKQTNLLTHN